MPLQFIMQAPHPIVLLLRFLAVTQLRDKSAGFGKQFHFFGQFIFENLATLHIALLLCVNTGFWKVRWPHCGYSLRSGAVWRRLNGLRPLDWAIGKSDAAICVYMFINR